LNKTMRLGFVHGLVEKHEPAAQKGSRSKRKTLGYGVGRAGGAWGGGGVGVRYLKIPYWQERGFFRSGFVWGGDSRREWRSRGVPSPQGGKTPAGRANFVGIGWEDGGGGGGGGGWGGGEAW